MIELFKAIYDRFKNDGDADPVALRAAMTDMFPDEAPEGTVFPFDVVSLVSTASSWTMGADGSDIDEPIIRHAIWDNVSYPDRVMAAGKLVVATYKDHLFTTLPDRYVVRADKIGERQLRDPDNKGWQYIVEFRYYLQTK